jgi:hypothetical protein
MGKKNNLLQNLEHFSNKVNVNLITKLQNTVKATVSGTAWSGKLHSKVKYLLVHCWFSLHTPRNTHRNKQGIQGVAGKTR